MEEITKEIIIFFLFGILCVTLGYSINELINLKKIDKINENTMLIAEDILHKQAYEYKQLWIEERSKRPIIQYTYVKEALDEAISN